MTKYELEMIKGHKFSDRYYELFEKISGISNGEFPLVDFLNDIEYREFMGEAFYDYESAYNKIEKIYNMFIQKGE